MNLTGYILIYFCFALIYRSRKINEIFILKSLQTLKISKYRSSIEKNLKHAERQLKWFFIWPAIDLYGWYENWKENKS